MHFRSLTVKVQCDAVFHCCSKLRWFLDLMSSRSNHVESSSIAILVHELIIDNAVFAIVDALRSVQETHYHRVGRHSKEQQYNILGEQVDAKSLSFFGG